MKINLYLLAIIFYSKNTSKPFILYDEQMLFFEYDVQVL